MIQEALEKRHRFSSVRKLHEAVWQYFIQHLTPSTFTNVLGHNH